MEITADELAFYDALTELQAIKDFYENEELIAITQGTGVCSSKQSDNRLAEARFRQSKNVNDDKDASEEAQVFAGRNG